MRKELDLGYMKTSDERETAFGEFGKKGVKNAKR